MGASCGSRKRVRSSSFVPTVNQISYNGQLGQRKGQQTTFVTERAVLTGSSEGLVVTEIAPGVRLREDVLDQIGFKPKVLPDLPLMDARIFREGRMGIRDALDLDQPVTQSDALRENAVQA